jgi:hypothetical protein
MKIKYIFISVIFISFVSFSQNKKEQIEILNLRIDSCKSVMSAQQTDINLKQINITNLEQKLALEKEAVNKKNTENVQLKSEIASLQSKLPPNANLFFEILNREVVPDKLKGTESEVEIKIKVENQIINIESAYGTPSVREDKKLISLLGYECDQSYEVFSTSSNKIFIIETVSFLGEEDTTQCVAFLEKDLSGNWNLKKPCYLHNDTPPSEWFFVEPKNDFITVYTDPIQGKKLKSVRGYNTSSDEIINGYMKYDVGWVKLSDLMQGNEPKTD